MVAHVDVGDEGFQPIGEEFHGSPEHLADGSDGHLLGIDVDLDPEAAADVGRNHPHRMLGNPELPAEHPLHLIGRLVRMVDRERLAAGIVIGDQSARLEREPGLAVETKRLLDDVPGRREGSVGLAGLDVMLVGDVVRELFVQRACSKRALPVEHRGQRLPRNLHTLGRVLRLCPRLGNHGGYRLPLVMRDIDGHHLLGRHLVAGTVLRNPVGGERLALRCHLGAGRDQGNSGGALCGLAVDGDDARVRMRRTHEHQVEHAREVDVADIAAATA